jgi:hypothetical protein
MLCLWHVRKAWAENVVKKVPDPDIRVQILKGLASVMYSSDGRKGQNAVEYAKQGYEDLKLQFPQAVGFFEYFTKQWMGKVDMWVTGFRNIPHAGQNTNAAVESYHANMKAMLATERWRFHGRRMDWLIYHLTGDVLHHYWYAVQCKLYGYIKNKNVERVVASAVLRARDIPDHFLKMFPGGQDIAQVISVNNYPRVYTVLAPGEEYAQCNCPWAERGNICKHAVKAYKMVHPTASETQIIQGRGSLHGTLAGGSETLTVDGFRGLSDVKNSSEQLPPKAPSQGPSIASIQDSSAELSELHSMIQNIAAGDSNLLDHALHQARVTRGKLEDLIASRVDDVVHPLSQAPFRVNEGDDSSKRKKGFLEKR